MLKATQVNRWKREKGITYGRVQRMKAVERITHTRHVEDLCGHDPPIRRVWFRCRDIEAIVRQTARTRRHQKTESRPCVTLLRAPYHAAVAQQEEWRRSRGRKKKQVQEKYTRNNRLEQTRKGPSKSFV